MSSANTSPPIHTTLNSNVGDRILGALQSIGRSLMLPIAVLPAAGLLLRLGQPDLLNISWMAAAGNAIFTNLPMIFAIGIAIGLTGGEGAAALGGQANVQSVEGCITRLRLFVNDATLIDDARLKSLGASGVVKRGKIAQVVMGTQSDRIASRINRILKESGTNDVIESKNTEGDE